MKVRGNPGDRIYETCDPNVRKYDDEGAEACRQARYARSTVREDGEHWIPEQTCSLEELERILNATTFKDRPKPPKPKKHFWRNLFTAANELAMYSSDPQIARMGEIQTIRRQVIPAIQQARTDDRQHAAALRAADEADEYRRMRVMAAAFFDEANERKNLS